MQTYNININGVGFQSIYNLKILKNIKDKINLEKIDVILKINFFDCNAIYIGQTKRSFKTRINEKKASNVIFTGTQ